MSEKLVYLGQLDCYERASDMASFLLNIETNDTAIYRLTDSIGSMCEDFVEDHDFRKAVDIEDDELLYVQCDGSMLLTREQGWKEVKLGRVFKSSNILPQNTNKQWIRESQYVGHYGSHKEFEDKMSMLIDDTYKKKPTKIVFIGDGARWQWKWCEAEYPEAIKIMDFYHVMEHIGAYIHCVNTTTENKDRYMKTLSKIIKNKGVPTTIRYLNNIPRTSIKKNEAYEKLMTYFNNNQKMMDYPSYIEKGYLIGSGAIESAHRTVLQKRMKQSGQRWSIDGLKNMINLRVLYMSGFKQNIRELIIAKAA